MCAVQEAALANPNNVNVNNVNPGAFAASAVRGENKNKMIFI
jgi:hypothetical protein